MILSCFYLFLLLIAPHLWVEPFVGTPIDYIVFPLWILALGLNGKLLNQKIITQDKLLILFVLWIAGSLLANGELLVQNRNMGLIIVYYTKLILVYYLVAHSIRSEKELKFFVAVFVILAVVLSVEGIQHKITGIGWAGQRLGWVDPAVLAQGGTGRTKWVGIFDGPGVFAVIYTVALPFLLAGTNKGIPASIRVFSLISIPFMLTAIYFNGSRGGFVTTMAVFLMHFGQRARQSKLMFGLGIILILVLFALAPSHMTELNDSSKSSYHRIEMWSEGFEMITQNPIFGIGRGNFNSYTGSLIAHNSAIEIMGETGFIGLFLWISLIYIALKSVYLSAKQAVTEPDKQFMGALFIAIAGYLVSGMFVTLEYETFYVLMALASVAGRKLETQIIFAKRDLKIVAVASIAWIAIVYCMINFYKVLYY